MRSVPLPPSQPTLLIQFTAKAEEEKKNKHEIWLIDAKKSLKEFLSIFLDFFTPENGALMQEIEFRAKLVAKEKGRDLVDLDFRGAM